MSMEYGEVEQLAEKIKRLNATKEAVIEGIAKELAARLLRAVIKRTPVSEGRYDITFIKHKKLGSNEYAYEKYSSGKNKGKIKTKQSKITGGTLRRGWAVDNDVFWFGDTHLTRVFNNVFYCTYVENGHRQTPGRYVPAINARLKRSWVPGKHMLSISVDELKKTAQPIIEKRISKWLNEVME